MSVDNVKKAISLINRHADESDFEGIKEGSLISLAENVLGIKFPESYKYFLKNLGCGDIAGQEFYGIIKDDFVNSGIPDAIWITQKERRESGLPNDYIIVASTGDGEYVVIDCKLNNVLLWTPGVKDKSLAFKKYYDDFGDFFYNQIYSVLN